MDGQVSNLCPVVSGVPQGTVLGPILFLIHIADIASSLSPETEASSFADDTRVLRSIETIDDCEDLQRDLQELYKWAEHVNMQFNADKFECLRFWAKPDKAPNFSYKAPDGTDIVVKSNLHDLSRYH